MFKGEGSYLCDFVTATITKTKQKQNKTKKQKQTNKQTNKKTPNNFNPGLYSDIYRSISFRFGMMIGTTKIYILKLV